MKLLAQSTLAFCHYDAQIRNDNRPLLLGVGASVHDDVGGLTMHRVERRRQQRPHIYKYHDIIGIGGYHGYNYRSAQKVHSRRQLNLSSFDFEEPNSDRPKKKKKKKIDENDPKRILGREEGEILNENTGDNNNSDDEFLNFDDEALLEELMLFSGDLDAGAIDLDGELEELERLIDEQALQKIQPQDVSVSGYDSEIFGIGMDKVDTQIHADTDYGTPISPERKPLMASSFSSSSPPSSSSSPLEEALLQGVVPASAGVGSKCLPGDYGFDPLNLSTKDYFKQVQNFVLKLLPSKYGDDNDSTVDAGAALPLVTKPYSDSERPPALILRDYREAEIRHGRLAMLAAILWPLQEIIDRLFIPQSFGQSTIIYGGVTLPFISLFMTLIMMLLGYLDIYAASIKDIESGDAFLPGECFWDPLRMLDGAPDSMKRKMQERELNNGRIAMVAVFSYILQEAITHQPVISLPWNELLFEPAFEIPEVQAWLDGQFGGVSVNSVGVDNSDGGSADLWNSINGADVIDGSSQIDPFDLSDMQDEDNVNNF